ncbi:MAG TPA: hypothetical protein VMC61_01450, partial [Methanocella sp.]|nr:hypothetical protein [Methanocella sp.]
DFRTTIMDGLLLIPANASNVRFVDLRNDSLLAGSIQKFFWLFGTLPPQNVFNAAPQRDLFAIYPLGYFGNFDEQFVSLTDFGTASINQSYPDYYNVQGTIAKRVNSKYYYTGTTKPVVSGRIENVAPVIDVMNGNNVSAYGKYADLFNEIKLKHLAMNGTTLEVVGSSCNLSYSDRFYAAIGPVDQANKSPDRLYYYVAVMHVNQTPSDQDRQELALLEKAMEKMGFISYRTQVYDEYIIIEAQGGLDVCVDNMVNRWGFIKYQFSV